MHRYSNEKRNVNQLLVKSGKIMKIVAFVLLIMTLAVGFGEFLIICNDFIPFKIEKTKVGPIINGQLITIFIANIIFCICEMYMFEKRIISIHFGGLLSVVLLLLCNKRSRKD